MPVEIEQFICRSDNFGVLVHDPSSGQTAIIDAPEEAAILAALKRTGWTPTMILTTHHHLDHVEANLALKERFKLKIVGPEAEKARIPGIDQPVRQGSVVQLGGERIEVIETPGHTATSPTTCRPRRWLSPPTHCSRSAAAGCSNASLR